MYKAFIKQFDGLTVIIGASLLGITLVAILAINHVFVDRLLLKDAKSLSLNAAMQIRQELFTGKDGHKPLPLEEASLAGVAPLKSLSRSLTLKTENQLALQPEKQLAKSSVLDLPRFTAKPLHGSPKLNKYLTEGLKQDEYLTQLSSYAIYLPSQNVYLPASLYDKLALRSKYSHSYKIVSSVLSVFKKGSSLYAYRESPKGNYTQHFMPITQEGKVVAVVMLEALQTTAGLKMAKAVSNAVSLTAIAGLPVVLLVIYLAWTRLRDGVRAQEEISFLELHDTLTELPNRAGFHKILKETVADSLRSGERFAIFSLDLDGFHEINDSIGHEMGDDILKTVVSRLFRYKPLNATIARLSGDEFAMILPSVSTAEEASQLANVFLEEVAQPHIGESFDEIICTGSIGINFGPCQTLGSEALLKNTKLALYRAKEDGGNTFRFFEPGMDKALQERRQFEVDLSKAIPRGEYELYYQPQVDLSSREVIGYEALLRWHHPEHGIVSPASFIPVLEESKMIVEVGEYVLERACREALLWPEEHKVAVNLSPVQFEHQNVAEMVKRVLASTGLAPERLEVEITESVLMSDSAAALKVLREIKALGVNIAMDDFGTGYSSLSYISEFEFDKIKIDRSFIASIQTDERARAITTTIIGLGRALDIMITSEGIETSEQLLLIQAAGCHFGQGYLFGRPMPLSKLLEAREDKSQVA